MPLSFRSLRIFPSYATDSFTVRWETSSDEDGVFAVERSLSGTGGWTGVGEGRNIREFTDTGFKPEAKTSRVFYRVVFRPDAGGPEEVSASVGLFEDYTPLEFNLVRETLRREFMAMRVGGGTEVFLLKALHEGKPCTQCLDPDTGQRFGSTLCPKCFGSGTEQGYEPAVKTWLRMLSGREQRTVESADGRRKETEFRVRVRMLPCPEPHTGDLIAMPKSGDRYTVGEDVRTDMLGGVLPVISLTELVLLQRNDIRYSIPLI